jgi:hypothetical protein
LTRKKSPLAPLLQRGESIPTSPLEKGSCEEMV